ncbi:hypothetical protein P3X46_029128 [Hevea brasiliensis]|uniref:Uncharacterized protein n=1 Tax=Hevea brasiliensis TaxID=3981 RepID=A0ABQ9KT54_HEVBR|nr:uncharacterized protein At1g76070-like [Hevea brasiliensis]KAJ9146914.1 hypothetical protein P3X46_029128 [Hevea brasiliensis]
MGKQQKFIGKISSILPKAATPVTFLSPPPSPVRTNAGKGFSSPRVSIIPKEVRRRARSLSFDAREPTSPKVSCTGQVKKKQNKKKKMNPTKIPKNMLCSCTGAIARIFRKKQQSGESDVCNKRTPMEDKVPSLVHLKQLASGRGGLQNFDMKARDVVGAADGENFCTTDKKLQDKEKVIAAASESIIMDEKIAANPR